MQKPDMISNNSHNYNNFDDFFFQACSSRSSSVSYFYSYSFICFHRYTWVPTLRELQFCQSIWNWGNSALASQFGKVSYRSIIFYIMDDITKIFMNDSKKTLPSNLPHAKVDWSHNLHKGNLLSPKTMQKITAGPITSCTATVTRTFVNLRVNNQII